MYPEATFCDRIHYIDATVHIHSQIHVHNEPDICTDNYITLRRYLYRVEANVQLNEKRK